MTALAHGERLKLEFLLFSPRPRDGYHLRALLSGDGYATLELRETKGEAVVTLKASEEASHVVRVEAWQGGRMVGGETVQVAAGKELKQTFRYPAGETVFRLYDGDTLVLDDSGAELALHLWVDVGG